MTGLTLTCVCLVGPMPRVLLMSPNSSWVPELSVTSLTLFCKLFCIYCFCFPNDQSLIFPLHESWFHPFSCPISAGFCSTAHLWDPAHSYAHHWICLHALTEAGIYESRSLATGICCRRACVLIPISLSRAWWQGYLQGTAVLWISRDGNQQTPRGSAPDWGTAGRVEQTVYDKYMCGSLQWAWLSYSWISEYLSAPKALAPGLRRSGFCKMSYNVCLQTFIRGDRTKMVEVVGRAAPKNSTLGIPWWLNGQGLGAFDCWGSGFNPWSGN